MLVSVTIPFNELLNLSNNVQLGEPLLLSQLDKVILDICQLLR